MLIIFTLTVMLAAFAQRNETIDQFLVKERALLTKLLTGYQQFVAPITMMGRSNNRSQEKMNISCTMIYAKLISLNETENTAFAFTQAYTIWRDIRLQWNPADYDGIELLLVNKRLLWAPDIAPLDAINVNLLRSDEVDNIVVYSNGTCTTTVTAMLKILCALNVNHFPFDHQTCKMGMTSQNFLVSEMNFDGSFTDSFDYASLGDGAWTFTGMKISKENYKNSLGLEYPMVTWEMNMKRSSTFYVVLLILPSFILTTLTVLAMFGRMITRDSNVKTIGLGFSSQLSQLTLLQIGSERIPKSDSIPVLSQFFLINISILAFSIFAILKTSWIAFHFAVPDDAQKWHQRLRRVWLEKSHCIHMFILVTLAVCNFVRLMLI